MTNVNNLKENSSRSKGKKSEEIAFDFLEKSGFQIIDKNWHSGRYGEIDVIAKDVKTNDLVFIEVKSRFTNLTEAKELVNKKKQAQIYKLANVYLSLNKLENRACRFDVIALRIGRGKKKLEHIKNAF